MEKTGTKKPQAGSTQKAASKPATNPFAAVIAANPELAAIANGAISGTRTTI